MAAPQACIPLLEKCTTLAHRTFPDASGSQSGESLQATTCVSAHGGYGGKVKSIRPEPQSTYPAVAFPWQISMF